MIWEGSVMFWMLWVEGGDMGGHASVMLWVEGCGEDRV